MEKSRRPAPLCLRAQQEKRNNRSLFARLRCRRRFERAEQAFSALADRTARLLVERLAGEETSGAKKLHEKEIKANLARLNALLEGLESNAAGSRELRLWSLIRHYDLLCMAAARNGVV